MIARRRLPAVRMFSKEFNASTEVVEEQVDGSIKVTKLLSPLGIKFGRVFVVGTLLDVTEAKKEPRILRARISDPLGSFTVFASAYTPLPLAVLSELEPPCFVAVVARPRVLRTPILRPEYITPVEASTFDRWVEETYAHTLKRIETFEKQESEAAKLAEEKYDFDVEEFKRAIARAKEGRFEEPREEEEESREAEEIEIDMTDIEDDFDLEQYLLQ